MLSLELNMVIGVAGFLLGVLLVLTIAWLHRRQHTYLHAPGALHPIAVHPVPLHQAQPGLQVFPFHLFHGDGKRGDLIKVSVLMLCCRSGIM